MMNTVFVLLALLLSAEVCYGFVASYRSSPLSFRRPNAKLGATTCARSGMNMLWFPQMFRLYSTLIQTLRVHGMDTVVFMSMCFRPCRLPFSAAVLNRVVL